MFLRHRPLLLVPVLLVLGTQAFAQPAQHKKSGGDQKKVVLQIPEESVKLAREVKAVGQAAGSGGQKNDWFMARRAWPEEHVESSLIKNAREEALSVPALSRSGRVGALADNKWQLIGPTGIGGRVTCIATHPTDKNTWYVGAASGGVWKTTDFGNSWIGLTDTFSALSIGAITIDPVDPNTIYVGQGEVNYSADSYPGNGLWRSNNAGASWEYLGFARTDYIAKIIVDPRDNNTIYLGSPGPNSMADTARGVYKSTDKGATWKHSLFLRLTKTGSNTVPVIDLVMNPQNSSELVAAGWDRTTDGLSGKNTGLWYTSDAGANWLRIDTTAGGIPRCDTSKFFSRPALYWANTSGASTLYAAFSYTDTNAVTHRRGDVNFYGLFSTTDPTKPWTQLQSSRLRIPYGGNFVDSADVLYRQGSYNFYLSGNPAQPDDLYLGGIDVLRSTDRGASFTNMTRSYPAYFRNDRSQHSDQHAFAVPAGEGSDVIVGSDGGVFHTTNYGDAWRQLKGMPITMFYAIEPWYGGMAGTTSPITPTDLKLIGGTQDNGTLSTGLTSASDWAWINRGDGGFAAAHPTDREKLITSLQTGRVFVRTSLDSLRPNLGGDLGLTDPADEKYRWYAISRLLLNGDGRLTDSSEAVTFIAPVVLDRERPDELYTARTRIYKAKIDYADPWKTTWSAWSPSIAGDTAKPTRWSGATECISIGARDSKGRAMLWAGGLLVTKSGTNQVGIWRTQLDEERADDAAPKWIRVATGLPLAIPTAIVPDPQDSMTAFVAFGRYQSTGKAIFRTDNGGKTWVNVTGNLPAAPVNALVIVRDAEKNDPLRRNRCLIAGTDVGVFVTTDGGATWATLGEGLPLLVVNDVKIYKNMLIAGTHGRSAWAIDIARLEAAPRSSVESNERRMTGLRISPNPAHGRSVTLYFGGEVIDGVELEIVAMETGSTVYRSGSRETITASEIELALPVGLRAGAYFVRAWRSGEPFAYQKFTLTQ